MGTAAKPICFDIASFNAGASCFGQSKGLLAIDDRVFDERFHPLFAAAAMLGLVTGEERPN